MRLTLGSTMVQVVRNVATVGWYGLAVGAPVYAGLTVVAVLTSWSAPMSRMGAPVRVENVGLDDVTGRLAVETLPTVAGLACVGLWLVAALVWLPAIGRLRRLMGSVLAQGPFVPRHVERLGNLGVTLIVVSLISGAAMSAMSLVAVTAGMQHQQTLASASLGLQLGWLLLGFVVVAFAEMFRAGVQLQTDSDLTI